MTKILVTGGLGFVGSHLVDSLADAGYNVTVMDNLCSESSSKTYMREDVTYWIDDVRNLNTYKYTEESFDLVYHLAALARIQPSFKDPLTYLSIDIMGSANVLEFARRCGARPHTRWARSWPWPCCLHRAPCSRRRGRRGAARGNPC